MFCFVRSVLFRMFFCQRPLFMHVLVCSFAIVVVIIVLLVVVESGIFGFILAALLFLRQLRVLGGAFP